MMYELSLHVRCKETLKKGRRRRGLSSKTRKDHKLMYVDITLNEEVGLSDG